MLVGFFFLAGTENQHYAHQSKKFSTACLSSFVLNWDNLCVLRIAVFSVTKRVLFVNSSFKASAQS